MSDTKKSRIKSSSDAAGPKLPVVGSLQYHITTIGGTVGGRSCPSNDTRVSLLSLTFPRGSEQPNLSSSPVPTAGGARRVAP